MLFRPLIVVSLPSRHPEHSIRAPSRNAPERAVPPIPAGAVRFGASQPWRTPRRLRLESNDQRERAESAEPSEPADPIDRIDAIEPTLPIDRIDPTLPMLRIEPLEAIDSSEPSDRNDQRDVVESLITS